jgi:hypothetical protein
VDVSTARGDPKPYWASGRFCLGCGFGSDGVTVLTAKGSSLTAVRLLELLPRRPVVSGGARSLHDAGFISNPVSTAQSVVLTDQGVQRSRDLFERLFLLAKSP